ncbi:low molecular weight phosphatase family protein [Algoriphagus antarcticus]|uniref:Protein-tyrosine-phosphatase n=1 Tax=Algoriphagus antarcticus TaxID=238540 RepID=A0A3E0DVH0_9BACT|nr:protein-tyrosine-phosphatase [Algoriphagus antarcticus]REG88624.1 protein-tyrosine-phosphatase [Algoriphagus antarcticus]
MEIYPKLEAVIDSYSEYSPSKEREEVLIQLVEYILDKLTTDRNLSLNFICTHNSRRSQLAQVWAQTAADYFGIPVRSFSGGVEATAFNERAVKALETSGFDIIKEGEQNPVYSIYSSADALPILVFSKIYEDKQNPHQGFAAIMTCDHADENCPFIPGADIRIPLRYEDPKAFDDTAQEAEKYLERSLQIGAELFFAFRRVRQVFTI